MDQDGLMGSLRSASVKINLGSKSIKLDINKDQTYSSEFPIPPGSEPYKICKEAHRSSTPINIYQFIRNFLMYEKTFKSSLLFGDSGGPIFCRLRSKKKTKDTGWKTLGISASIGISTTKDSQNKNIYTLKNTWISTSSRPSEKTPEYKQIWPQTSPTQ